MPSGDWRTHEKCVIIHERASSQRKPPGSYESVEGVVAMTHLTILVYAVIDIPAYDPGAGRRQCAIDADDGSGRPILQLVKDAFRRWLWEGHDAVMYEEGVSSCFL